MPITVLNNGIETILSLQNMGAWLVGIMQFFTFLGSEDFYFLVLPVVIWCVDAHFGIRLAAYLVTTNGMNNLLKMAFHGPRPYWIDGRVQLLTGAESGFGIPSGHSQNSVVLWGGVAAHLRRWWAWGVAILLFIFVGISRMYLGVHFPTDVYVGWAVGLALLALLVWLEKPFTGWFKKFSIKGKLLVLLAISVGLIAAALIIRMISMGAFPIPAEWAAQSLVFAPDEPIAPFSLDPAVTVAGTLFGLFGGAVLFNLGGWLDARGLLWKRVLRFVVGVVGVLILWRGLGSVFALFAENESFLGLALRYFRYTLVGGWITWVGPLLFIRLGLAKREN